MNSIHQKAGIIVLKKRINICNTNQVKTFKGANDNDKNKNFNNEKEKQITK